MYLEMGFKVESARIIAFLRTFILICGSIYNLKTTVPAHIRHDPLVLVVLAQHFVIQPGFFVFLQPHSPIMFWSTTYKQMV